MGALVVALILPASAAFAGPERSPRVTTCTGYSLAPADGPNIPSIVNAKPAGTVFCFAPGTYRITQMIVPRNNDQFIGTGATRADVILTGAKVLVGWTASSGLYVHTGDVALGDKGGVCFSGDVCRYSDWLFRNGLPLTRVLSPCTGTNVKAGVFCIEYSTKKTYVHDDPTGQTMAFSYVPRALDGGTGVVVRNLTVDKFANTVGGAGAVRAGTGWLLDNISVQYNHGCGVGVIGTSGTLIQNSRLHDNGQLGYCGTAAGARILNNEIDHNNFLGVKATWGGGGGKLADSVNVTVSNNNVHDNNGNGIWFDVDSVGAMITGNTSTNNSGKYGAGNGITYEISCNATIQNNVSTGNGMSGIQLRNSHNSTVGATGAGNMVANNVLFGIRIIADKNGTQSRCGAITANNNTVKENSVTMLSATTGLTGVQSYSPGMATGNIFDSNDYHIPSGGCSATRWTWWNGSETVTAVFSGAGKTWQGTFKQDPGPGGSCGA